MSATQTQRPPSTTLHGRALETVLAVSALLNSTLDLEEVVELTMHEVTRAMGAETGAVLLLDQVTEKLLFYVALGEKGAGVKGLEIPRDKGIVGHVVRTGQPLLVPDVTADPRFYGGVDKKSGFVTRSVLCAPLRVQDRVIGALEVCNKLGRPSFLDEEMDLFTALANQVALAIENARLYSRLSAAYRELEKLERKKSDFMAVASHELRTPLTSLVLYLEMLSGGVLGAVADEQREALEVCSRNASRLVHVTNDVTNMVEVGRRDISLDLQPASVADLLEEVAREVRYFVGERRQTLKLTLAANLPLVRLDRERVHLVVHNLVMNAIRYTPDGGRIEMASLPREPYARVEVRDTGIGIAESEWESIFLPFYRVQGHEHHSSGTYEFGSGGMGLGLSIAKGVVEAHKGRIGLTSEPGKGSVFFMELPLE
ncbi:MAG: GAF domain-containing sensor histidine kinase [Planctomycetes bacterium]|nr:GAF domain-containing sensor histidine kinase [Planctomycetota bacterium]